MRGCNDPPARDPFEFLRLVVRVVQFSLGVFALVHVAVMGDAAAMGDVATAVGNGGAAVVDVTIAVTFPKLFGP